MKKLSILLALVMLLSGMGSLTAVNAAEENFSNAVFESDFEDDTVFDEVTTLKTSQLDEEHGKSYSISRYQTFGKWKKDFEDVTSGKVTFSYDTYYENANTQFTDLFNIYIGNQWNSNTLYRILMARNSKYEKDGVPMPNAIGLVTGEASYVLEDGSPTAEFNKWMHIDVVVDLDGDGAKSGFELWINGELKMTKTLGWKIKSVNSLEYVVENAGANFVEGVSGAHYIDNMKVTTNANNNLEIIPEFNTGYTDIVFSDTVKNLDEFTAADLAVTENWEDVAVTSVKNIDYNKLRIYHEGRLDDSGVYAIKFNKTAESILGKTPALSIITNESTTLNAGKTPAEFIIDSPFENKDDILSTFERNKNVNIAKLDDDHGNSLYSYRYIAGSEFGTTFAKPIDSGKAIFSFDMYLGEQNTQFHNVFKLNVDGNGKEKWDYVFFISRREDYKTPRAFGFTTGAGNYDVMDPMPTYEYDKWQHVDLVVNLDNEDKKTTFDMYVDGEYKMSREVGYQLTLNGMYIGMENNGTLFADGVSGADYIDNFRIAAISGNTAKAGVKFADGKSKLTFTESIPNISAISADNVTITKNGRPLAVTAVKAVSNAELVIEHDGYISDEDVYEITLPENLTSILGNTLNNVVTNKITVTSVKTKDSNDNEAELAEIIPANTKEISITFDGDVDKAKLDKAISLTTDGAAAESVSSYDAANRVYKLELPNYLKGSKDYMLSIAEGAGILPISKSFKTEAGAVTVSKIAFYQNDAEVTDLSAVTGELTLRAEIVNTTGEDKPYSLSYGAYVGSLMKDMDFVEGTIAANEVKATKEVKLNITKASGMIVKGYIWDGMSTMTPYSAEWAELK